MPKSGPKAKSVFLAPVVFFAPGQKKHAHMPSDARGRRPGTPCEPALAPSSALEIPLVIHAIPLGPLEIPHSSYMPRRCAGTPPGYTL